MKPAFLVRYAMTIGVPTCRDTEPCSVVQARLDKEGERGEIAVVLDENGMACGWLRRDQLGEAATRAVGELMDEDIPAVSPDIALEAAAQIMRDRGVDFLFLMHDWPGEPRPSAFVSRAAIAKCLSKQENFS